jgi:hypothetical protein
MSCSIRPSPAPPGRLCHDSHDPAGASEACRNQNQLICAALLGWRKTEINPRRVGDLCAALSTGHTRTPRLASI